MSDTFFEPRTLAVPACVSRPAQARGLIGWIRRRQDYRQRVSHTEWDLRERYGAAALRIATSSSRQAVGREARMFWRDVARRLQRNAAEAV